MNNLGSITNRPSETADLDFSVVEGDLAAYTAIEAAFAAVTGAVESLTLTDEEPRRTCPIGASGSSSRYRYAQSAHPQATTPCRSPLPTQFRGDAGRLDGRGVRPHGSPCRKHSETLCSRSRSDRVGGGTGSPTRTA